MAARFDYVPGMNAITVILPDALQTWLESRIADGVYADATDYVRDLMRRDQEADRHWVKAMIDEGLASGICEDDALTVLDAIIAEDPDLRD